MNYSWKFSNSALISRLGTWILVTLLAATTAHGATYYVAMAGNDSNPGTVNQPFKTFKKAVSLLQPGDTLYIRGGLYKEQINLQGPKKTGTAGAWLKIAGYPGETVTIRFADPREGGYGTTMARGNRGYIIFENMIWDGSDLGNKTQGISIRDGNHHFILRNIEIKNHKGTAIGLWGNDHKIIGCKLHDNITMTDTIGERHYGIYNRTGNNNLIDGNDIYNNDGGGITLYPGPISSTIVRNNHIHHNNRLLTSQVEGIQLVTTTSITDVQVYNNVIYLNGVNQPDPSHSGGIRLNGAIGTKIWNNTIYGNKGTGIKVDGFNTINTVVQNNIVFANTLGEIMDSGTGSTLSHNLISGPSFMNAETFNFKLQANSSAINAGITLPEVTTDVERVARPVDKAYDIGAYEGGISDSASPTAPKDLSAK